MENRKNETVSKIENLIDPVIRDNDLELVDIEYKSEGRGKVLRVYIDKQGGVNIDDCTNISRELGVMLDVHDIIPGSYSLEVSSPGLTRQLKKHRDFERNIGKKLRLKLKNPVSKQHVLRNAALVGINDDLLEIEYEGVNYSLGLDEILKANLELDF